MGSMLFISLTCLILMIGFNFHRGYFVPSWIGTLQYFIILLLLLMLYISSSYLLLHVGENI